MKVFFRTLYAWKNLVTEASSRYVNILWIVRCVGVCVCVCVCVSVCVCVYVLYVLAMPVIDLF